MRDNISARAKVAAYYEVLAGSVGIFVAFFTFVNMLNKLNPADFFMGILLLGFSFLSVYSGTLLLKGSKKGLVLSYAVQVLQTPFLMTKNLYYAVFIMLSLHLGLDASGNVTFGYLIGANMSFAVGTLIQRFAGINIAAVIIMILMAGCLKKPKENAPA
jgi:ABC-type multidrug transport system permease subunit